MNEVLTWGALIAAGGSIIAIITFWMNRGKAEAENYALALSAQQMATAALAKVEMFNAQLTEARLEMAREYATSRDLASAENRFAAAVEGMRNEMSKLNDRLDRILESYTGARQRPTS